MKSVMNYAAMSIERLTDNVPFRMAILGPSPPYEYPINELLYVGERSVHEGHVEEQNMMFLTMVSETSKMDK